MLHNDKVTTMTSILRQAHLSSATAKESSLTLEAFPNPTDQRESLSLLRKCKSMTELKQIQAQTIKSGLFKDQFFAENIVVACSLNSWGSMDHACSVFHRLEESPPEIFLFNVVIRGFVRDENWARALGFYDELIGSGVDPDGFTYPALLKACARSVKIEEGKRIHGHSIKLGLCEEDDVFVQNSLLSMYGKCGELEFARKVFDRINRKSVASWSAMIGVYVNFGKWRESLELFGEMSWDGNCRPEESALVGVISACARLGALDLGMSVHAFLTRNIDGINVVIGTSLVDMYVNCGCLEKGLSLFQNMGGKKNRLTYSVIISGLGMDGRGEEALTVFEEMIREGFEPDEAVFVGVLSACSHAGLVKEGLRFFESMRLEHGIEPTMRHYGCLVDLLGRAGRVEEALGVVENMPVVPNKVVWRTLLGACKVHGDVKTAEVAARHLFRSEPQSPGDYIVMSNIYAKAQKWDDFARVRTEMVSMGLAQNPGFCTVEVKRKVFKFMSNDYRCRNLDDMMRQMEWQLRFDGYVADTSLVLLDVSKEEKRERLKYHSQKIAIAFALIHSSGESPVRIVRNLRMCSDCHTYTKFISTIYQREIIVRDRNRFHRFKNGTCSCRDYW